LKSHVNLTILTSSCMSGGILSTQTPTPGVLLAGCHETQFSAKALTTPQDGVVDPWIFAIVKVIKKQAERKRGVPTYGQLLSEAKKYIKQQVDGGQLSEQYKGPSSDETNPIARDHTSNTSHQDPQLAFRSDYIDPDHERFLFPFADFVSGEASGNLTRYPKDEL
jgi:hypothetical protein